MKQRRRIYYSAAQRSEIWDRWQAGESMKSIGRRFDRASSSVFSVISPGGRFGRSSDVRLGHHPVITEE
jgi:transposase, IS30 family